ncbi:hypothetical protein PTKIN_Ptkin09bG0033700 [Pterospermum kingtungense]
MANIGFVIPVIDKEGEVDDEGNSYDDFCNPPDLVFFLEGQIQRGGSSSFIKGLPSPRLFFIPPSKTPFDLFCKGVSHFGPFWVHVLVYRKASLESPNKVLFLKYEDVNKEPFFYVRKLAEFLGLPFSSEEENKGIVQEIVKLCSSDSLSNNQQHYYALTILNSSGKVK